MQAQWMFMRSGPHSKGKEEAISILPHAFCQYAFVIRVYCLELWQCQILLAGKMRHDRSCCVLNGVLQK